jgi:hypothetical protein
MLDGLRQGLVRTDSHIQGILVACCGQRSQQGGDHRVTTVAVLVGVAVCLFAASRPFESVTVFGRQP